MGSGKLPYAYPIINLSKASLDEPGSDPWVETCKNVRRAFEEHGFFIAVQDRISLDLSNSAFQELEKLFGLPKEIKARNTSDNVFYFGYQEPNKTMRLAESLGIEDSTSLQSFHKFAELMWPSGNDNFCEVMHAYAMKVSEIQQMVCKMIMESYGLDEKYYESHNELMTYVLRVMKYRPPYSDGPEIGADVHTDKDFVTIVDQNQVNAVQIKPKNQDIWVDIHLPPASLIAFAGDAFVGWSNGRIHASVHRVMIREKVTRYSIAQFQFQKKMIQVPEELVDEEHPLQFNPFDNFGLLRFFGSPEGRHLENLLKAYCGI